MKKIVLLICVQILTVGLFAQNLRTIKGRVTDSNTKDPLIGATVFIAPSEKQAANYNPQGVITDNDGNYTFSLPSYVKNVIVSYVGYTPQTLRLTNSSVYNVSLAEDVNVLGDVVVTGYQRIERRKLTSSVAKVDGDNILQVGAPSVDQLLSGQVAGLVSTPTAGGPGAANKIRIRGTVSLTGSSDPLWVLDGIPLEGNNVPQNLDKDNIDNLNNLSIAGLNPNDIQDITILKDAAATAIYGARAANGVIVITTKKGREGKIKINFSADLFHTFKPDFDRLNLMNSSEKVDFELGLLNNPLHTFRSENGEVARILNRTKQLDIYKEKRFNGISLEAQQQINALRTQGINWFDEIYRSTWNQQYGISLSGGSQLANYYFSSGYYSEQGVTKGTSFDRFNIALNTDFNISSKLKFSVGLFANQNDRKTYLSETGGGYTNAQNYTRRVNPYLNAYDEKGNYIYDQDMMNSSDKRIPFNYLEEQANSRYTLKNQSFRSIFELGYQIIKPLRFSSQLGLQIENNATEKYAGSDTYYNRNFRESYTYKKDYIVPEGGIIQNYDDRFFQYNWRNQLFFQKRFDERYDVDLMAGMEMRRNTYTDIQTKGFGFDENAMTTKPVIFPNGYSEVNNPQLLPYKKRFIENAFLSYFGTASYTLDDKYTLFGSIRMDGSNLFGVDLKYRYLPLWSVSAAWNAGREQFIKDLNAVSNLKFRASYGLQGNIDKETSPFVKGEWKTGSFFGGQSIPVIVVSSPPNQYLRWEKTSTMNGGFDLGFLDNRINLSFDAYRRRSTDLISSKMLPYENGFNTVNINWAQVTNRGWELSLSTLNVKTPDFKWFTDFNISQNISNVDRIETSDNSYFPSREGYPVNAVFGIQTAGLDKNGIMQFKDKEGNVVSMKDFYKLNTGIWGDVTTAYSGVEFRNLFTYMGDADPQLTGGFINRFLYKNFDLAISTSFFINRTVRATPFYNPTKVDPGLNYPRIIKDIWSSSNHGENVIYPAIISEQSNDETIKVPAFWINQYDNSQSYNYYDIWIKKISYLRVSSIRLGYNLNNEWLKRNYISNVRLSLEARNPFVFGSNYSGYFDPETYGNIYSQPIPQSIAFGLNISF